jgi:hypothetical protein
VGLTQRKKSKMQVLDKPQASTYRLPFSIKRPTYQEAKTIIRGQVFTLAGYHTFRKSNPQFNLPSNPDTYWKNDGWKGCYEFFGTTKKSPKEYVKQYWADVRSGKRVHAPKYKAKNKPSQVDAVPEKTKVNVVQSKPTILEDKQAFIALAKKLGVYERFRPAFKTLFTVDELLDLVNL